MPSEPQRFEVNDTGGEELSECLILECGGYCAASACCATTVLNCMLMLNFVFCLPLALVGLVTLAEGNEYFFKYDDEELILGDLTTVLDRCLYTMFVWFGCLLVFCLLGGVRLCIPLLCNSQKVQRCIKELKDYWSTAWYLLVLGLAFACFGGAIALFFVTDQERDLAYHLGIVDNLYFPGNETGAAVFGFFIILLVNRAR